MSVRVMGLVWDLDLPPDQKFVLLALADHADHEGTNAHPGIGLLAQKCSYSERQVQYAIGKLKAAGLIRPMRSAKGGRGAPTVYEILLLKGAQPAPFPLDERVQDSAPFNDLERVHSMHPLDTEKGAQPAPFSEIKGAIHDTKGCNPRHDAYKERARLTIMNHHVVSKSRSLERESALTAGNILEKNCSPKLEKSPEKKSNLDELVIELQQRSENQGISVAHVATKMLAWCATHNKQPTRRRLLEWCRTEERPLKGGTANGIDEGRTGKNDTQTGDIGFRTRKTI